MAATTSGKDAGPFAYLLNEDDNVLAPANSYRASNHDYLDQFEQTLHAQPWVQALHRTDQ